MACKYLALSFFVQAVLASGSSRAVADSIAAGRTSVSTRSSLIRREGALADKQPEPEKPYENVIWCFYDYKNGPSPFVKLNFATWRKHAPEMKIMMVNDSNVRDFIPDIPKEYFMLPYASAKSDFLRAALLYHHGGLYMDTDFLVGRPLREVMQKLDDGHDIVTYWDVENIPSA